MQRQGNLTRVARALAAFVLIGGSAASAQTPVTPVMDVTTVNAGPGNQTDPHVSGHLVTYTSSVSGTTQIRYFDLSSYVDAGILRTDWSYDFLSDVNGTHVIFTRVESGSQSIWYVDTATSLPAVELSPVANSNRRAASIGGNTVSWQDLGFSTGGILTSEIVAYDLQSMLATRITNDQVVDRNPAVSPDGNVIAWEKCDTSISPCDIWQAVKGTGGWTVSQVTATSDPEAFADLDGVLVVYGARRAGSSAGADIYWTPVAGGAETQLALPGEERNPNISGSLIVFESRDMTDPTPNWDIYAYDLATDILYRLTDTPILDETLNDVFVDGAQARVAYSVFEIDQNVYARTFTLLPGALQYDFTGTGGFQAPIGNPPSVNVVNAGRVVPIKWQLRDGAGAFVTDVNVVTGLVVQAIACDALPTTFESPVVAETAGSSGLIYDSTANQFVFKWATMKDMAGGCYAFVLGLDDGSQYPAYFRLQ